MQIINFAHKLRVKKVKEPLISYPVIAACNDEFNNWSFLIVRKGMFEWVDIGNGFYLFEEVEESE